ncbi:diacylglycerol/lipid kinase family protein [Maribacter cobaltidurans]|uniref:Diacylglycerol kinase n=1 Tax=Maribacter cobaltidurans TaxID=1178778 RepID=A0A223V5R8_9FLAO|nr:YegS/Rv2252/BmrU family lipid kinase [Maribacter cobaltidurans]ASV30761.1 diacylglycerol kinase [Maribacter cobaltidurans]GGD81534.1 hypothetical protein GCM10011412_19110 [Maribacter cobaltidurans]
MKKNVLLVINPIAGGTDKKEIIAAVRKKADGLNIALEIYKTTGEQDGKSILKKLEKTHFSRVLIAGGDGTVREVVDAIKDRDILVGILPSGSANGLALNLNIPDNLEEQLKIAFGNAFIVMDILEVNGSTCLHIADMGVNAALIENYEESEIRGKLGYLLQAIPTLTKSKFPFFVTIEANGKKHREEVILVAIANARKFGTGANINPTGQMDDNEFEILLFKNFDIVEIIKTFYGDVSKNSEFVTTIKTKDADIRCEEPIPFQVDGEFMGYKKEINARLRPEKLKILYGR